MSTVISFTNQKGGVGKTTFSTQLAYYLATTKKKKVLFIDMDAQGSASETLLAGTALTGTPSEHLFNNDLDSLTVQTTEQGIDLIGSNQSAEAYDVEALPIEQVMNPHKWVSPILKNYDYVIIDCPPSLGRRLIGSLILTDFVICPIKLSGYAVSGLKSLFSTLIQVQNSVNPNLKILGIAVNEYQGTAVQRDALYAVNEALPGYLFESKIRSRSPIDIASRGKPIAEVRNGQRAAEELHDLFEEMLKRIAEKQ